MDCAILSYTARDGYNIAYRRWKHSSPRGYLVFLHGIQSHGGWYLGSCRFLWERGYDVSFLERRGSGLNETHRGHAENYRQLLDDIDIYIGHLRSENPAGNIHLAGISWGGKLAFAYPLMYAGKVVSIALIAPGLVPQIDMPAMQKVRIAWAFLFAPEKLFDIPLNTPELFTENPKWIRFLQEDPLMLRKCTAKFFIASRLLDIYIRKNKGKLAVPASLFLAGKDKIIDNEKTTELFEAGHSPQKVVNVYEDASHTLEFEPNPQPIFTDMYNWFASIKTI